MTRYECTIATDGKQYFIRMQDKEQKSSLILQDDDLHMIYFDTKEQAETWIKDHDTDEQIKAEYDRIHVAGDRYMKAHHIQEEDVGIVPVVEGYIITKKGKQEEWDRF